MERLGVDHLPLLYLHDPENTTFEDTMARGGAVETLQEFKREGIVDFIGVAGGWVGRLQEYIETGLFDVVLTHNRYTLVDRSAEPLIQRAYELGVGVVNGAPFGGGLLATYPSRTTRYHYAPANLAILRAANDIGVLLAEREIPIGAAALQFSLRDSRISSTLAGARVPEHVDDLLRHAELQIPVDVWTSIEQLVPGEEHWIPWPLPEAGEGPHRDRPSCRVHSTDRFGPQIVKFKHVRYFKEISP